MNSKKSPISHTLTLLRRLMSGERLTVKEIVAEGKFSDDAVRRHFEHLEATIPGVRRDGRRNQTWCYRTFEDEPGDNFGLLGLTVASTLLSAFRGSELDHRLRQIVSRELVSSDSRHTPGDLSRMFYAKSRMINPLGLSPDAADRIVKAIFEQRLVEITYELFNGQVITATVRPYTLIFSDEGLYAYGHCTDSDEVRFIDTSRLYNMERMRGITITRNRFSYPPREEYDPERLYRDCVGVFVPQSPDESPTKIVLEFESKWRAFLHNHKWHKSQSYPQVAPNGQLLVTFTLYVTQDLVRWVRSLGSEVNVIEPARLAQWVESGEDPETQRGWA